MINLNLLVTLPYLHSGAFLTEDCDLSQRKDTLWCLFKPV